MTVTKTELKNVLELEKEMETKRQAMYMNLIQQINTKTSEILKDDMGSQFIQNCGRDIAGGLIQNYFNTAEYNITIDQLANRILTFNYENDHDPLGNSNDITIIKKSLQTHNEFSSRELDKISDIIEKSQKQLFPEDRSKDSLDAQGKKKYRESKKDANGDLYDELTGKKGTSTTITQNGKNITKSNLHADHVQARESASYTSKYLKESGVQELKEFWNSADNMQLIHASANTSKGDVRVCEQNGKVVYLNSKELKAKQNEGQNVKDITYKATAEQLADATIAQWEKDTKSNNKTETLKKAGYLDENGKVKKDARKRLIRNIKHSQNIESLIILKGSDYVEAGEDAFNMTKSSIGKIIAGQIIYYSTPPIIYEVRYIINDKSVNLDNALDKLTFSLRRVGNYVLSKISDIFSNVAFLSLKKFVNCFMDILIEMVKATVKKLLNIAKQLLITTVNAVRIVADSNSSKEEKADSVMNLFSVTIASCAVDALFGLLGSAAGMPDFVLSPLQLLTSVICTNLVMLILQKMDLFDVRFGFKMNAIRKMFDEEYENFTKEINAVESYNEYEIAKVLYYAKQETKALYDELYDLNPKKNDTTDSLNQVKSLFSINLDFNDGWNQYLGL